MHMISVRIFVHWLNNHTFTGAVNARPVRVYQQSRNDNLVKHNYVIVVDSTEKCVYSFKLSLYFATHKILFV
jgi:hypothetical protein